MPILELGAHLGRHVPPHRNRGVTEQRHGAASLVQVRFHACKVLALDGACAGAQQHRFRQCTANAWRYRSPIRTFGDAATHRRIILIEEISGSLRLSAALSPSGSGSESVASTEPRPPTVPPAAAD